MGNPNTEQKTENCPPTWEYAAMIHSEVLLNRKANPVTQHNAQLTIVDMGRKLDNLQRYIKDERAKDATFTEETLDEQG